MINKELNRLMGINLRKFRFASNLTQDQLAGRILGNGRLVQKWEVGKKGIGKKALISLCKVLNVKPYAFYIDDKTLLITRSRELAIVNKLREAEKLGVFDLIEQFSDFTIRQVKKVNSASRNGRLNPRAAHVRQNEDNKPSE